jgi:Kef-type K+ transport system membrane component KefB
MPDIYTQLGVIFTLSVLFITVALRLKLPPVVGILLAGAIAGPHALGLVGSSDVIEVFAEIGAALLLFFVGLKFNMGKLANVGLRSFIIWAVKDGMVFILVYELSRLLGLDLFASLVLASALCVSSTTFFIKLVADRNLEGHQESEHIFVVLIIEDLLAVFLLAVYSGMGTGMEMDTGQLLISILKATIILAVTGYLVVQRIAKAVLDRIAVWNSEELMLFFSLGFALLLSIGATYIGLASSIGAFLAGNILSSLKGFNKKAQDSMEKFSMLFSLFFFLSIGMRVDIAAIAANAHIILALYVVITIGVFFSMYVASFLLGMRSEDAVRAGLLMISVGEFSLLIARQTSTLVPSFDILTICSALVFMTALTGGVLMRFDKPIDSLLSRLFPGNIREASKAISQYLNRVLADFEPPEGKVYRTFSIESKKIAVGAIALVITLICCELAYMLVAEVMPEYRLHMRIATVLIALMPAVSIIISLRKIFASLALAFHTPLDGYVQQTDMAIIYSFLALFMLLLTFLVPIMAAALSLPREFGLLFIIPLFLSLIFVWNLGSAIRRMMFRKDAYRYEMEKAKFVPPYRHMIGEMASINVRGAWPNARKNRKYRAVK